MIIHLFIRFFKVYRQKILHVAVNIRRNSYFWCVFDKDCSEIIVKKLILCYNTNEYVNEMRIVMDIQLNDILEMKKPHPCGKENNRCFLVLRIGMDFKLKCMGCGHEVMVARQKAEKNIRKVIRK